MANNKLVNGDVLQSLISELENRCVGTVSVDINDKTKVVVSDLKGEQKGEFSVTNTLMEGATSNVAGKTGLVPAPAAGKQDMALCGDATFKVLPIVGGGTGADNATAARTNLGIDTTYFNPTGTIIAFAGNTLPKGYLLCDGSKVSRTTYKKLFDVIGTTYGAGDGSTTFTLPNLIDRFLEGSSAAGSYLNAGLPNITGSFDIRGWKDGTMLHNSTGAMLIINEIGDNAYTAQSTSALRQEDRILFDASKSNSAYGNSTTIQPAALTTMFLIKY